MSLTSSLLYQSGKIGDEPFILTGPVIGMVTDATARILIETSISCTVECKLKTSNGVQISQSISAEKRIPKCFNFGNLTPGNLYVSLVLIIRYYDIHTFLIVFRYLLPYNIEYSLSWSCEIWIHDDAQIMVSYEHSCKIRICHWK